MRIYMKVNLKIKVIRMRLVNGLYFFRVTGLLHMQT